MPKNSVFVRIKKIYDWKKQGIVAQNFDPYAQHKNPYAKKVTPVAQKQGIVAHRFLIKK